MENPGSCAFVVEKATGPIRMFIRKTGRWFREFVLYLYLIIVRIDKYRVFDYERWLPWTNKANESKDVPFVLTVMEENEAQDLNKTYKLWATRFNLFTRFNEGIMADPETLYSGPPEVLAKHIAARCSSMETIIDPFCGSGAIAIQLAMIGRKVIAMDHDPARVKCAKNNARVYEVADHIHFVVGDFFAIWNTLERANGIVTSPPEKLGKFKTAQLMKITSRLVPKALIILPSDWDNEEIYRIGSSSFKHVKMETVRIDRQLTCVNVYLGPATNYGNIRKNRNEAAERVDINMNLFTNGVPVNRRVEWVKGNNLFAYEKYLDDVQTFLK